MTSPDLNREYKNGGNFFFFFFFCSKCSSGFLLASGFQVFLKFLSKINFKNIFFLVFRKPQLKTFVREGNGLKKRRHRKYQKIVILCFLEFKKIFSDEN
jgi:hypothetical protein